jgi:hypothetical protein
MFGIFRKAPDRSLITADTICRQLFLIGMRNKAFKSEFLTELSTIPVNCYLKSIENDRVQLTASFNDQSATAEFHQYNLGMSLDDFSDMYLKAIAKRLFKKEKPMPCKGKKGKGGKGKK